jgi:hypothetical protein
LGNNPCFFSSPYQPKRSTKILHEAVSTVFFQLCDSTTTHTHTCMSTGRINSYYLYANPHSSFIMINTRQNRQESGYAFPLSLLNRPSPSTHTPQSPQSSYTTLQTVEPPSPPHLHSSLLQYLSPQTLFALSTPLNLITNRKKRIGMLSKSRKSWPRISPFLLLLPLLITHRRQQQLRKQLDLQMEKIKHTTTTVTTALARDGGGKEATGISP